MEQSTCKIIHNAFLCPFVYLVSMSLWISCNVYNFRIYIYIYNSFVNSKWTFFKLNKNYLSNYCSLKYSAQSTESVEMQLRKRYTSKMFFYIIINTCGCTYAWSLFSHTYTAETKVKPHPQFCKLRREVSTKKIKRIKG